jgi:hypothetical protein
MNIPHIEGRFAMYRSTQTLIPLQTVVIGGYVMDEQDSDGTHYNLPRESDLNFSVVLKALRAMLCLNGSTPHSTASSPQNRVL